MTEKDYSFFQALLQAETPKAVDIVFDGLKNKDEPDRTAALEALDDIETYFVHEWKQKVGVPKGIRRKQCQVFIWEENGVFSDDQADVIQKNPKLLQSLDEEMLRLQIFRNLYALRGAELSDTVVRLCVEKSEDAGQDVVNTVLGNMDFSFAVWEELRVLTGESRSDIIAHHKEWCKSYQSFTRDLRNALQEEDVDASLRGIDKAFQNLVNNTPEEKDVIGDSVSDFYKEGVYQVIADIKALPQFDKMSAVLEVENSMRLQWSVVAPLLHGTPVDECRVYARLCKSLYLLQGKTSDPIIWLLGRAAADLPDEKYSSPSGIMRLMTSVIQYLDIDDVVQTPVQEQDVTPLPALPTKNFNMN